MLEGGAGEHEARIIPQTINMVDMLTTTAGRHILCVGHLGGKKMGLASHGARFEIKARALDQSGLST